LSAKNAKSKLTFKFQVIQYGKFLIPPYKRMIDNQLTTL